MGHPRCESGQGCESFMPFLQDSRIGEIDLSSCQCRADLSDKEGNACTDEDEADKHAA